MMATQSALLQMPARHVGSSPAGVQYVMITAAAESSAGRRTGVSAILLSELEARGPGLDSVAEVHGLRPNSPTPICLHDSAARRTLASLAARGLTNVAIPV